MCINKNHPEEAWISLILRIAMSLLFALASIGKFVGGIGNIVTHFQEMFKATWLPSFLVTPYAYGIAFAEALIAVWLLSGIKLRAAWVFTSIVLVSLAFGLLVAQQPTVEAIYTYIIICCVGIYVSKYDECVIGGKK